MINKTHSNILPVWIVVNVFFMALVAVGVMYDVVTPYLVDETYITHAIIGTFLLFLLNSAWVAYRFQMEWYKLDDITAKYTQVLTMGRGKDYYDALMERRSNQMSWHRIAGPMLVSLGLLGTVVGIVHAVDNITADVVTDTAAAGAAITALVGGLATALNTTLVGITGMIWFMINLHLMQRDSTSLYAAMMWRHAV